jgi:hypothetical protein
VVLVQDLKQRQHVPQWGEVPGRPTYTDEQWRGHFRVSTGEQLPREMTECDN